MALPSIKQLWSLGRKVEDLFDLQKEAKGAFADAATRIEVLEDRLDARLRAVEDRLIKLEAEQGMILSEAKREASNEATRVNNDIITRLTRLEMGLMLIVRQRPSPPDQSRAIRGDGATDGAE
jgi:hypothetical protein